MKLLFLDFDGVLVTSRDKDRSKLCPVRVGRLNRIIAEGRAYVCITTARLEVEPLPVLVGMLRSAGFTGVVLGAVTTETVTLASGLVLAEHKGHAIQGWIQSVFPKTITSSYGGTRFGDEVLESFVILDDLEMPDFLLPFHVRPNEDEGLQDTDVERAVRLLNSAVGV